jgi:hypothetical protein
MFKLKLPRNFNKMTLSEQETILVNNLQNLYILEKEIRNALAKIRGGNKFIAVEVSRPDEALLKS